MIYVSLQDPRIFGSIALQAVPILVRADQRRARASNDRRAGQSARRASPCGWSPK